MKKTSTFDNECKEMRFRQKLEKLINSESMENGSDTPDFILAEYLGKCLITFDEAVNARALWYGHEVAENLRSGETGKNPIETPKLTMRDRLNMGLKP